MRVILRLLEVEVILDGEVIFVVLTPSLRIDSAHNEYGVPVNLNETQQRKIAAKVKTRVLAATTNYEEN